MPNEVDDYCHYYYNNNYYSNNQSSDIAIVRTHLLCKDKTNLRKLHKKVLNTMQYIDHQIQFSSKDLSITLYILIK